jgi:hypothetical protein
MMRPDLGGAGRKKESADRRGPHVSERRERRCYCRNAQTLREGAFWLMVQGISGLVGLAGEAGPDSEEDS